MKNGQNMKDEGQRERILILRPKLFLNQDLKNSSLIWKGFSYTTKVGISKIINDLKQ